MRQRLAVSFSGGKTSAYMAKRLKDEYSQAYEMAFIFANTGEENEETLIFVDRCDREWQLNLIWVEAEVHHDKRLGSTHRLVNFTTASRKGEPFKEVIKKYGIPNKAYPHCTRELKLNPMESYFRSLGWTDYLRAVGIRIDEPKRLGTKRGIVYPLAHWFSTTKVEINDWWEEQPFTLNLPEHRGNCKWCWKKSLSKHIRIAQETPEVFDFPARMERDYGLAGHNEDGRPRTFFREHRSTRDIITLAQLLNAPKITNDPDENSGCSESCEAF